MKKLSKINESTLWGNTILRSDTGRVRKEDEITEDYVLRHLDGRYKEKVRLITIRKENGKQIVDIDGTYAINQNITEFPFKFGKITGGFYCDMCKELTSLEGCPDEVGGDFSCSYCFNLKSLEGCPKKVGETFYCKNCGKKFTEEEVRNLCDVNWVIK